MIYHLSLKEMRQIFSVRKFNHQSSIINRQYGFTLIELLIVVAIIGILSALLMTNFIEIRKRARDAQRKSDIRQIQSALELYRSDTGSYPTGNSAPGITDLNATACPTSSGLNNNGTVYMAQIPCDPLGTSGVYDSGNYYYTTTSGGYILAACLENVSDSDYITNGAQIAGVTFNGGDANCTSGHYFVKTNP